MENQTDKHSLIDLLSKDRRRFLMGFAIITIFIHHLFYYPLRTYNDLPYHFMLLGKFFKDGYIGVDIFMFISAYGLCYSYRNNSLPKFYRRRAVRILPFYLGFAVLFTFLFMQHLGWEQIAKVWTYQLTGLAVLGVDQIQWVEWFVPALLLLYAFFPLLYHAIGSTIRYRWPWVGFIVILSLFADVMSWHINGSLAGRIGVILLGIMTFFILDNEKNDKSLWALYLICALLTVVSPYRIAALSILTPLLLLVFSRIELQDNTLVRGISFIGTYSFEIYLAQQFATEHVLVRLSSSLNLWLNLLLCLLITPPLAVLFHYVGKLVVALINRMGAWRNVIFQR